MYLHFHDISVLFKRKFVRHSPIKSQMLQNERKYRSQLFKESTVNILYNYANT